MKVNLSGARSTGPTASGAATLCFRAKTVSAVPPSLAQRVEELSTGKTRCSGPSDARARSSGER
jgi:hypothetical protein